MTAAALAALERLCAAYHIPTYPKPNPDYRYRRNA